MIGFAVATGDPLSAVRVRASLSCPSCNPRARRLQCNPLRLGVTNVCLKDALLSFLPLGLMILISNTPFDILGCIDPANGDKSKAISDSRRVHPGWLVNPRYDTVSPWTISCALCHSLLIAYACVCVCW